MDAGPPPPLRPHSLVTRAPPALAQGYSLAAMKPSALILNDTLVQPPLNALPPSPPRFRLKLLIIAFLLRFLLGGKNLKLDDLSRFLPA